MGDQNRRDENKSAGAIACLSAFRQRFGREPTCLVRAPGRVNLIGEHVDYNDGLVLPMAIEAAVWIAAAPRQDGHCHFVSTLPGAEPVTFADPGDETPRWGRYLRGVAAGLLAVSGRPLPGCDALVYATVPPGGGLSSSAALTVATLLMLEELGGERLADWTRVLLCQQAEQAVAGVPCGFMDQFASVFSRQDAVTLLDCRDRSFEFLPIRDEDLGFLVVDSKKSHDLSDGGYAARRRQCEAAAAKLGVASLRDASLDLLETGRAAVTATEYQRARHVISENARTTAAAAAIRRGDWEALGELLYAGHASLRDDFEVSTPELDALVEIGRELGPEQGIWGARMTGAGFGGCVIYFVKAAQQECVAREIMRAYRQATGIETKALPTRPSAGAATVPLS